MEVRPLQDRVLVERTEEENRTKGGIIIPTLPKKNQLKGKLSQLDRPHP